MKTRLLAFASTIFLTGLLSVSVCAQNVTVPQAESYQASGALTQTTEPVYVTIPVAALAQTGKVSTNQMVVTLDGSMTAGGQTMPLSLSGTIKHSQKYGATRKDGLTPMTTSFHITGLKGNVMGKPITQTIAKKMPGGKMPVIPPVTSLVARDGTIRSVKIAGLKEISGLKHLGGSEFIAFQPTLSYPVGKIEMGRPVTIAVPLPSDTPAPPMYVHYTPIAIEQVGGEKAVRFKVDSHWSLDMSQFAKLAASKNSSGTAIPDFGGNIDILTGGDVWIGTKTGEIVRQSVKLSLFTDVNTMGMAFSVEGQMGVNGKRI